MGRRRRRKFKFRFDVNPKIIKFSVSFLIIFALLLTAGYFIYNAAVFKIKKQSIRSNVPLSANLEDKIVGKSLFKVDIKIISEYLARKYPEYKIIYVTKRFPASLLIQGIKREALAQIKSRSFYPIDRDCILLDKGSNLPYKDLVIVEFGEYNRFFRKGFKVDADNLKYAFDLITDLKTQGFTDKYPVKTINPLNLATLYFLIDIEASERTNDNVKVIIGEGDFPDKIRRLKKIINGELKDRLSLVKYIDLRFKKVYIEFKR